jgi:hypothetical protein
MCKLNILRLYHFTIREILEIGLSNKSFLLKHPNFPNGFISNNKKSRLFPEVAQLKIVEIGSFP